MTVGQLIKVLAYDAGLNQKELTKKMGISEVALSEVISGKRGLAVKYAKKLDEVFGVPAIVWLTFANIIELENRKIIKGDFE
jgi:plasmid maintenance system antidote protein VapI